MKNRSEENGCLYEFADFKLLPAERLLLRDDQSIPLPPKVFDTLLVLVERGGHLVEKGELLDRVWADAFVEEATLARNISILRKVLDGNDGQKFIETVPKSGYRFTEPVRRLPVKEKIRAGFRRRKTNFRHKGNRLVSEKTSSDFMVDCGSRDRRRNSHIDVFLERETGQAAGCQIDCRAAA